MPASPSGDNDRVYACSHCPKRYARKDYLERHELNHTRPQSVCPACGKGFARPDVLRKHLSTSCKSRRGSDGDAPAPLTTAEEDALVPRKRRRPQRRHTMASMSPEDSDDEDAHVRPRKLASTGRTYSSSSSQAPRHSQDDELYQASSAAASMLGLDRLDRLGRLDSRLGERLEGRAERFYNRVDSSDPRLRGLDAHVKSERDHPRPQVDRSALSDRSDNETSPKFSRMDLESRLGRMQPPQLSPALRDDHENDGPGRAGASLDLPLAPAFAATPETLGGLSFTPKPDLPEWSHSATSHERSNASPAVRLGPLDVPVNTVPASVPPVGYPMPELRGEVQSDLGGWTGSEADSMDDLFSWLFNIANNTGSGVVWPHTPGLELAPLKDEDASSTDDTTDLPLSTPTEPFLHSSATGLTTCGLTHTQPPESHARSRPNSAGALQQTHPRAHPHTGAPFPTLPEHWSESDWRLPPPNEVLDDRAAEEIHNLFEGNVREDLLSPAFSLGQMRLYFELYFLHFAPLYPVIHRPSLGYRRLPPDLLLTMLCIGTAFAEDKEGFKIATRIHKRLRNRIFEMVEEEPRAPLHNLQTILLINHFSRCYCSMKEHDVAQVFHSPSIIMTRLAGVFLPTFSRHRIARNPLEHWLEWVDYEERKRVGWLAFLMDTENAALFRHYLLVHCFSVQVDWPSSDEAWFARNPFIWSRAQAMSPRLPSFRNALRDIAGRGLIAPTMSELNLWILLHGLISVSWTLLWRDLGDLSMIHESKITHWKDSLRRAFGAWREHTARLFRHRLQLDNSPLDMHVYWAGIPFAHLGCILLLSDTESIRIYAGASSIAGRPVSPGEWSNASNYVQQWAGCQDGAYSCAAAVELLSQVFKWSHEARFRTAPSVVPWCLYVAALIIWTYATSQEGYDRQLQSYILPLPSSPSAPNIKIEPSLARRDALEYLARLSQARPFDLPNVPGKNRCAGVIAYTAYLAGTLGRGVMEESRNVLLRLLTKSFS